jgi:tetratricopeptide (TPR) repeat protein
MSQLINVKTGETEQTFRSESKLGDIFEIQDVVSSEIGNSLFASFGHPIEDLPLKRGTDNEKAYELYLEGLYLVDKFTREDSAKAVEILESSTKIDPNFSAALAVKAQAYCQFAHLGGGEPTRIFSIAQPILDKALVIDTDNAVALTVRGMLSRDYYWKLSDAYRDVNRAIEIDPNFVMAYRVLSGVYYCDGKFSDAVEIQKKAVELNPTDIWEKWFLADYQIAAGNREDGIENLRRMTEMDPSFHPAYYSLWRTYLIDGDIPKAFEFFIKNKESWQDSKAEINRFKKIYKTSGWDGVLEAELSLMRSQDKDGQYSTRKIYIAELAAQLGQNDLAFHFLEEAASFRLLAFSYTKVNPLLNPLHSDPRFNELLKKYSM